ncbi:MAG: RluA family pseudouridine synthase [Candidatus Babeliales bacterium]
MNYNQSTVHTFIVSPDTPPMRLDLFLTNQLNPYSRTFIQKLIKEKQVLVNGAPAKSSGVVEPGAQVTVTIAPEKALYDAEFSPEQMSTLKQLGVGIVHIEDDFLVINKPAGLMSHKPSPYCTTLTLIDWLAAYSQELLAVGHPERPGIVHRLDKDTSGLMLIARNNFAHHHLSNLFKSREIKKTYIAVVQGHPEATGTIDAAIGRNPIKRNQMTVNGLKARVAQTLYKIVTYYDTYSVVEAYPQTGRTHQIRVHFSSIGHPIIGDPVYGTQSNTIARHALHASALSFTFNGRHYHFTCPLPADMAQLQK